MPDYIKVPDIMRMYGVAKSTVYNWIDYGMPSYKMGVLRRFKENEVDNWIRNELPKIMQK
jgi:excisionase family DNA binding protein